jgi:hypothetical protein
VENYILDKFAHSSKPLEEFARLLLCELLEPSRSTEEKKVRSGVQAIVHTVHKRNLFITENGSLGLSRDSIREGNEICVLFGGSILLFAQSR